jgi:hypothetical protein
MLAIFVAAIISLHTMVSSKEEKSYIVVAQSTSDKKIEGNFLKCLKTGFVLCMEMHKYLVMYDKDFSTYLYSIRLCNQSSMYFLTSLITVYEPVGSCLYSTLKNNKSCFVSVNP